MRRQHISYFRPTKAGLNDLTDVLLNNLQVDLGIAVQRACESVSQPLKFLYPLDISIKEKIEAIARSYGASGVEYSEQVSYSKMI